MVVKVYISGISGNKEVKKRQQRVLMILDSRSIKYEVIDIAEPGNEEKKDFMQNNSTSSGGTISDPNPRHPLPPQIFNDDMYCGDYDQFDLANEIDEMEKFLKMAPDDSTVSSTTDKIGNGEVKATNEANGTANSDEKNEEKTDEKIEAEKKTEVSENQPEQNAEAGDKSEDKENEENEKSEKEKEDSGEGDKKADETENKENGQEEPAEAETTVTEDA